MAAFRRYLRIMLRKKGLSLEIERFRRGEGDEFRISTKKEMQTILRDVAEKGTRVLLYYDKDNKFIVTTLLGATEDGIWLETSPNAEANALILQSKEITIVTQHRGVKVQFSADAVHLAPPNNTAFYMELPPFIFRIQRRDFFRLSVPLSIPIQCVIPVRPANPEKPELPEIIRTVPIVDISGGGVALFCEEDEPDLTPGRSFSNCTINLPDVGPITVSLTVRNSIEVSMPNDVIKRRVGCQFNNMDLPTSTQLQRYISRLQSEALANQRIE